jgi:hypothetical protein
VHDKKKARQVVAGSSRVSAESQPEIMREACRDARCATTNASWKASGMNSWG